MLREFFYAFKEESQKFLPFFIEAGAFFEIPQGLLSLLK